MKLNDNINILAVDDIAENLVTIEALLARPGLNVIKASSGTAALEVLLTHEIALALVDVQMPHMDGFELAELIRGSARTRHVPLIFLTAGLRETNKTFRGYEAGAVDFLYKPIDVVALQSKVNVFVEMHAKEQQLSRQLEELRQALAVNQMFTAVLGHDLRNPLAAISMGADLLLNVSDNAMVISTATRIQSSSQRMSKMVDQLLDVARIRAGSIDLHLSETNYEVVCQSIIDELAALDDTRQVKIETEGNVIGIADPDRLSQILSNLLANAFQHGDPAQPIRVHLDGSTEDQIVISVHNGGVIPAAAMDDIFEPFHEKNTTGKKSQGLGLGLYIVNKFTDLHGGHVTLNSSDDQGTVFCVEMPRKVKLQPTNNQMFSVISK